MISVNVVGGLGNQLFQIFAAIAYSMREKTPFVFPLHKYDEKTRPTYWDEGSFLHSLNPFVSPNNLNLPIYREPFFQYKKLPRLNSQENVHNGGDIILHGYFQSYKYFQENYNTISRMIRIEEQRKMVLEKCRNIFLNDDVETVKYISLHFRLGDYKRVQHCHNLLQNDYYMLALKHIINIVNHSNNSDKIQYKVIYFCEKEDDAVVEKRIEKINELINRIFKNINISFIRINDTLEDWEQMLAMSLCEHNIIANSSFSWWGAYINDNPDKIVTYPSIWFGPMMADKNVSDLFPDDWKMINL